MIVLLEAPNFPFPLDLLRNGAFGSTCTSGKTIHRSYSNTSISQNVAASIHIYPHIARDGGMCGVVTCSTEEVLFGSAGRVFYKIEATLAVCAKCAPHAHTNIDMPYKQMTV